MALNHDRFVLFAERTLFICPVSESIIEAKLLQTSKPKRARLTLSQPADVTRRPPHHDNAAGIMECAMLGSQQLLGPSGISNQFYNRPKTDVNYSNCNQQDRASFQQ